MTDLKTLIRNVPDFPKQGILFYDITTLLKDKEALKKVIDTFAERYHDPVVVARQVMAVLDPAA